MKKKTVWMLMCAQGHTKIKMERTKTSEHKTSGQEPIRQNIMTCPTCKNTIYLYWQDREF